MSTRERKRTPGERLATAGRRTVTALPLSAPHFLLPVPRILLPFLYLLFALAVPTSANGDGPPRLALHLDRNDAFPFPYALEELAGRAIDCAPARYEPVPIPDNNLSRLQSLLNPGGGAIGEREQKFIASEGRRLHFDAVVFLETRLRPEGYVITCLGAKAPFKTGFSFALQPAQVADLAARLPALADTLLARSVLVRASNERARTFPHATWESEDLYVEGARYGDFPLLAQALEADDSNEAARSLLGFRLTLGDNPAYGWGLLQAVDSSRLSPFDRAVHTARLELAKPGGGTSSDTAPSISRLHRDYPGRFESELAFAIPFARRGDIRGADRAIRRAIALRPHDPLPHRILAEAGLRAGIADVAAQEFAVADRLAGGDWLSIIGMASTKYTQGFVRDAYEILSNPMPPRLHTWSVYYKYLLARGNLSLATGDFQTAIAEFVSARDRAYRAGNREAVLDLSARLVWANLEAGRIDEAAYEVADLRFEQDTTYFFEANPGIVPFLEGVVAAHAGDLGEVAARRLEIETTPGAPGALALIIEGLYYLKRDSAWEAIPAFRRATESMPGSYTRFLLGMAYFESGDASRAWTVLEENVERGESLLDSPPVLPQSFHYLAKSLKERGEDHLAAIAYNELYNYRRDLRRSEGQEERKPPSIFYDQNHDNDR